jgi:DNA-binding NarL/FixJ family response regulator
MSRFRSLQYAGRLGERDKIMTGRCRILIADDHTVVAELCKTLLEGEFDVIGTVSDGRTMVSAACELKPDVILLDIGMPILNGLDAGRQVKQVLPLVKLIYLTMTLDAEVAAEAFERGASGYLIKTCDPTEIIVAVRHALCGKTYLSGDLSVDKIDCLRWGHNKLVNDLEHLTDRQREVLQLLAEGKAMKEISDILNVAESTVAYHKYRLMKVLGAKSNAELFRFAVRHHMIAA